MPARQRPRWRGNPGLPGCRWRCRSRRGGRLSFPLSPYVARALERAAPAVENRTIIFALSPPMMLPTGQETADTDEEGTVQGVEETAPLRRIVIASTLTDDGNATLRTTCVAVAPPIPDWLVKFVIETASPPVVKTCGVDSLGDARCVGGRGRRRGANIRTGRLAATCERKQRCDDRCCSHRSSKAWLDPLVFRHRTHSPSNPQTNGQRPWGAVDSHR